MKLQYNRPSKDKTERKPESKIRKAARWVGKTARNVAFATALPLLALASAGCESTGRQEEANVCSSYNDSTVSLNRETDGKIARITELKKAPEGEVITESLIDFINETHALSTEGMPGELMLTQIPEYCMPENAAAYVVPYERGAYVPAPVVFSSMKCTDVQLWVLNHEIGHFQETGMTNEVIAQLNAVEQIIMGYVVFSKQTEHPYDIMGWASTHSPIIKLETLYAYSIMDEMTLHAKANLFVARRLVALNGDFRALREEVNLLDSSGILSSTIDREVEDYRDYYYSIEHPPYAEIINNNLELRKVFFMEIERRFGTDTANAYVDATSYATRASAELPLTNIVTLGLEGFSCLPVGPFSENGPIELDDCTVLGTAAEGYELTEPAALCCISAEDGGFKKWKIHVSGYSCIGQMNIYDQQFDGAGFVTIESREELGSDELCY